MCGVVLGIKVSTINAFKVAAVTVRVMSERYRKLHDISPKMSVYSQIGLVHSAKVVRNTDEWYN